MKGVLDNNSLRHRQLCDLARSVEVEKLGCLVAVAVGALRFVVQSV